MNWTPAFAGVTLFVVPAKAGAQFIGFYLVP